MDWPDQVAAFDRLIETMGGDDDDEDDAVETENNAPSTGEGSGSGMSLGGTPPREEKKRFIMDTAEDDEMFAAGVRQMDDLEMEFQQDAKEFKSKHMGEVKGGLPPGEVKGGPPLDRPDIHAIWTKISGRPEFVWQAETKEEGKKQVFLWNEHERERVQMVQAAVDLLRSYPSKSRDAQIQFVLDTREKGPIRELMLTVPQATLGTCANGDAQLLINELVHHAWERKAYSDASQHIGTSVQEQHLRLLKCGLPRQQIEWIFEHEPLATEHARKKWKPKAHLDAWGAAAKFRDGVKFEWRADMLDTVYHWMRAIEAYLKHGHMFVVAGNSEQLMPTGDPDSGALLLKNHAQYLRGGLSKSKIKTPDQQWEAQLGVVVGAGVAAAITKVYPTMESLSVAYMELHERKGGGDAGDAACAEMLTAIPYSAKPAKGGLKTIEQMEKKTTRAKQDHVYPAQSAAVYNNYKGRHKGATAGAKRKAPAKDPNKRPAKKAKKKQDDTE